MESTSHSQDLLSVRNLKVFFNTPRGVVRAVDNVSFSLKKGEILGIVGESGCGKSVTAQTIMRLIPVPPGEIKGGHILFDQLDLVNLPLKKMKSIRGKRISMIFQEPMSSLNPVKNIGFQIAEMFSLHGGYNRKTSMEKAVSMLEKVQIAEPARRAREYPHQLSGGMRQRAMIAMALSCNPEILIADEPTTALDVTVQAQIIELMKHLQKNYHTSIMMITHDLGIIAEMTSRVVVMYAGKIVEMASTLDLFDNPMHPYTQGLLNSVPTLGTGKRRQRLQEIKGMVPSLSNLPQGCFFCPRCHCAMDICREKMPELTEHTEGHWVRCWKCK